MFFNKRKLLEPVRVGNFCKIVYESSSDRNKILSIKEYLSEIKPYLKDIINILKKSDTWETQLIIVINFMPSKDTDAFKE